MFKEIGIENYVDMLDKDLVEELRTGTIHIIGKETEKKSLLKNSIKNPQFAFQKHCNFFI
jgi:hypothetical protein